METVKFVSARPYLNAPDEVFNKLFFCLQGRKEVAVECSDELKETHKICMDCIGKMIKENQKEISDEEIKKGGEKYGRKGSSIHIVYTNEIKKLIKQAHFDGQFLHTSSSKLLTKEMLDENAEYYSNEIIQSLKPTNIKFS
jgi:hypothetical protein